MTSLTNQTANDSTNFSKAKALSLRLGIHPKTLARWGASGRIARYKLNDRVVLYNVADVMAFVTGTKI